MSFFILLTFVSFFFFFNDTATTEIYTLSLHDALPISRRSFSSRPHQHLQLLHSLHNGRSSGKATRPSACGGVRRSEEHTSELQSHSDLVCRLLLEKKKKKRKEEATRS